jgi:hypothetical protein
MPGRRLHADPPDIDDALVRRLASAAESSQDGESLAFV